MALMSSDDTLPLWLTASKRKPLAAEIMERMGNPMAIPDLSPQPQQAPIPSSLPPVLNAGQELPMRPLPQTQAPLAVPTLKGPSRSDQLQAQYDQQYGQKPSLKSSLLQAVASLAPVGLGAAFGGSYGAAGAAQGSLAALQRNQDIQGQQRGQLLQEIENQRNREERGAERQSTVQDQMQGVEQRANAALERAQSIEDVAKIRGQYETQIQGLKDLVSQGKQSAADTTLGLNLAKAGFKRDASGNVVPLSKEEMSPGQQKDLELKDSLESYRKAQTDHAQAQADLERARNNPNSPAFKQAQDRLNTTAQRLALSQQQFEMRAFGTNNGQALPGSLQTDAGQTVGTAFQQNVRPTGQERNKADLANSAHDQIQDLKSIVQKRKDIFGPVAGRTTDFNVWLGSQDPDAQRFRAARTIAGDHLAGVFGGRSEAALSQIDSAIGQFKDNPDAVLAGLDQLDKANQRFISAGKVRASGSTAASKVIKYDAQGNRIQ